MSPMLKACWSPVCDLDWQSRNGPETIGQRGKGAGKGSDGRVVDACGGREEGCMTELAHSQRQHFTQPPHRFCDWDNI